MITLLKAFVAAAEANGLDYETAVAKANACGAQLRGLDGEHAHSIAKACGAECAAIELDAVSADDVWVAVCHRHKHRHGTLRKHWQETWPSAPRCGCQIRYAKTGERKAKSRADRLEEHLLGLLLARPIAKSQRVHWVLERRLSELGYERIPGSGTSTMSSRGEPMVLARKSGGGEQGVVDDFHVQSEKARMSDMDREIERRVSEVTGNWRLSADDEDGRWWWTISDDRGVIADGEAASEDDAKRDGRAALLKEVSEVRADVTRDVKAAEEAFDDIYRAVNDMGAEDGDAEKIANRVMANKKLQAKFKKEGAAFLQTLITKRYVSEASLKGGWEKATPPDGMPASKPGKGKSKLWWAKPRRKKPEAAKPIHEKTLDEHKADKRKDWEKANAKRKMTPEEKRKALIGVDVNAAAEHRKAVASAKRKGIAVRDDVASSVKAVTPKPKSEKIEEPSAHVRDGEQYVRHAIDIPTKSIFANGKNRGRLASFNAPSIAMSSLKGADEIWHHQGNPKQVLFEAAQKDAPQYSIDRAAEIRAATNAGYRLENHRAGKYGTLWTFAKNGRTLTKRGISAIMSGKIVQPVDTGGGRENALSAISAFNSFVSSLPESTRGSLGSLVSALNRAPSMQSMKLQRDDNGKIVLSDKDDTWRVYEPTAGHVNGEWIRDLDSSLGRFLTKIDRMASTPIGNENGDWAVHDRDASEFAVAAHSARNAKQDDGPKDGDRNEDGLVFRNGRWHRDEEPSAHVRSDAPGSTSQAPPSAPEKPKKTFTKNVRIEASGNTLAVKDTLKSRGWEWDRDKKVWFQTLVPAHAERVANGDADFLKGLGGNLKGVVLHLDGNEVWRSKSVQPSGAANSAPGMVATQSASVDELLAKHGRTLRGDGKPATYVTQSQKGGGLSVGDIVPHNNKDGSTTYRMVTKADKPYYVSSDHIEDMDAWSTYKNGRGWYQSYVSVPVEANEKEAKAGAAKAAEQARSAKRDGLIQSLRVAENYSQNGSVSGMTELWGDRRAGGSEVLYTDGSKLTYVVSSYDDGPRYWTTSDKSVVDEAISLSGKSMPGVADGPKDGDRNEDGLVFRNGRWHRDEEPSAHVRSAFTPSAITDVSATERKTVSWAWFGDVAKGIREGAMSADDLRAQFESLVGNRDAVIDSLSASLKKTGLRSKEKIAENARHMFDRALNLLTPGIDSIQYAMSLEPGGFEKAKIDAYRKAVNGITDEHLASHREKVAATVAAREKSLSNPETLDELEKFISARGESAMTPTQRAAYDSLYAERRRENDRKRESHRAYVAPTGSHDYEIHEGIHTKHNKPIFVVKLNNRVGADTFKDLATKARQLRGNWQSNSRYSGGKTPDGFNFDSRGDAERFGSLLSGTGVSRAEDWEESRQLSAQSSAQRLREMADRVEERSRESLGRDRLANTHRRAEHAASAEAEAQAGLAWSSTARKIADGVESGSLKHLGGIRHGTHIDELGIAARRAQYARQRGENRYQEGEPISVADADHAKYPYPYFDKSDLLRLSSTMRDTPGAKRVGERIRKFADKMGDDGAYLSDESFLKDMGDIAKNPSAYGLDKWQSMSVKGKMNSYMRLQSADIKDVRELRAALREYIPLLGGAEEDSAQQKIKKMERSLIGRKIPGFFPTPRHIVDQMISTADIQPGMSVLEPSAGKGDILDAVRESVPDADTHGVEINGDLRAIIEAKGHKLAGHDFTEHSGQYDRILMNPPFESGQDAEHVQRAYDMLKPGGRLVAIMSEGPFFRGDKKSFAFRDWLDNVGGDSEKLPEDSFGGSDAFRQTGVNTRMVTITKPA